MSSRVTGVVLIYALFAAGWILFSDSLVALLLTDPEYVLIASTLKGWAFVGGDLAAAVGPAAPVSRPHGPGGGRGRQPAHGVAAVCLSGAGGWWRWARPVW